MGQSLASITIVGRLTRDAELKYIPSGEAILSFDVATDSKTKKDGEWVDEASFWSVSLWGKRGESIAQYLLKGKQVAVSGSARIERWEQEGVHKQKVKINANDVQMLGSKDSSEQRPEPKAEPKSYNEHRKAEQADFSDDIPF